MIVAVKRIGFWWKLSVGLFFIVAAVDRAIYGGRIPSLFPTFGYALFGIRMLAGALRTARNASH